MLDLLLIIDMRKLEIRGPVLNFEITDSGRVPAVLEPNNKTDNSSQTNICQSTFREDTQVLPYKSSP